MNRRQHAAIIKALKESRDKHTASPEAAREYLYSELGTHNRDGSLCKQYGGEYTDPDHPIHHPEALLKVRMEAWHARAAALTQGGMSADQARALCLKVPQDHRECLAVVAEKYDPREDDPDDLNAVVDQDPFLALAIIEDHVRTQGLQSAAQAVRHQQERLGILSAFVGEMDAVAPAVSAGNSI